MLIITGICVQTLIGADDKITKDIPREDYYIYHTIPDAVIQTQKGKITLYQLLKEGPLLFTMVYTRCGGVCYPFIFSLKKAVNRVGGLGKDYQILVISFDPMDTPQTMRAMAQAEGLADNENWIFGTTSQESIKQVASSIGYWAKWDSTRKQYDHPAVLIGLNKKGKILRFLVGASVPPVRLAEVINEIRGKFIPSYPLPRKNVIFSCFQYDPEKGIRLDWGFLLLLLPGIITLGGTLWIFRRHL
ncbi:MAG: SCO family protein [Calditrichaeota bacterium]|nr:MAG: SCO family protein [Calditrichota bacterium]